MITSVANRTVRSVRKLRKRPWRERQGSLLCEGHRALAAALESRVPVHRVLHTPEGMRRHADLLARARSSGAEVLACSREIMTYLTAMPSPPDVMSVASNRERAFGEHAVDPAAVLLLDVRDPGAAGAIVATAHAAGARAVLGGRGSVDLLDPKTIRAGMGAQLRMDVVRGCDGAEAVRHHRARGASVVALTRGGTPPWDAVLTAPVLFVIDGERGSSSQESALADERVCLPEEMPFGARAAALLYEWMRQADR